MNNYLQFITFSYSKTLELIKHILRGIHDLMVTVPGKGPWVQILDGTDCISLSANTLGKGMALIILPPVIGKF